MGPMETPNRIVLPGMDVNVSEDGLIVRRDIDHYAAPAPGGHHRGVRDRTAWGSCIRPVRTPDRLDTNAD